MNRQMIIFIKDWSQNTKFDGCTTHRTVINQETRETNWISKQREGEGGGLRLDKFEAKTDKGAEPRVNNFREIWE